MGMKTWDVRTLDADPHKPEILSSGDAARIIALTLPAGGRQFCVAFSPDGTRLAGAGGGPVMVWRAGRTADLDP